MRPPGCRIHDIADPRAKTDDAAAADAAPVVDKGKGKSTEEPLPEPEKPVDEDDEDPEDLIIDRPRRRAKVDYTSAAALEKAGIKPGEEDEDDDEDDEDANPESAGDDDGELSVVS